MKAFFVKNYQRLKTTKRHWVRQTIAVLLIAGGLFGFLPVVGFWMLPLGLALLAVDFPFARRLQRRLIVRWGRLRQRVSGTTPSRQRREGGTLNKRGRDT